MSLHFTCWIITVLHNLKKEKKKEEKRWRLLFWYFGNLCIFFKFCIDWEEYCILYYDKYNSFKHYVMDSAFVIFLKLYTFILAHLFFLFCHLFIQCFISIFYFTSVFVISWPPPWMNIVHKETRSVNTLVQRNHGSHKMYVDCKHAYCA